MDPNLNNLISTIFLGDIDTLNTLGLTKLTTLFKINLTNKDKIDFRVSSC